MHSNISAVSSTRSVRTLKEYQPTQDWRACAERAEATSAQERIEYHRDIGRMKDRLVKEITGRKSAEQRAEFAEKESAIVRQENDALATQVEKLVELQKITIDHLTHIKEQMAAKDETIMRLEKKIERLENSTVLKGVEAALLATFNFFVKTNQLSKQIIFGARASSTETAAISPQPMEK